MEVTSHPFEFAGQKTLPVMAQDITLRKQAEKESLESKLIAERYLNIAAEIIVALDSEGNITHLNESGQQLLGYEASRTRWKKLVRHLSTRRRKSEVQHFFQMTEKRGNQWYRNP